MGKGCAQVRTGGYAQELRGVRPGTGETELLVLTEVAQDFSEISQVSATANDRYLASKMRKHMMWHCMEDETVLAELQKFDQWSSGKAAGLRPQPSGHQAHEASRARTPHREAASGRGTGPASGSAEGPVDQR